MKILWILNLKNICSNVGAHVSSSGNKNQIFDQFKKNSYNTQDKKCRTNQEDYENVVDQAYFL